MISTQGLCEAGGTQAPDRAVEMGFIIAECTWVAYEFQEERAKRQYSEALLSIPSQQDLFRCYLGALRLWLVY